MSKTLSSGLAWWAKMTPDAIALVVQGDRLSYRAYHEWADRAAVRLIELGVKPGDRVIAGGLNSLAYCALVMGLIRAGGILRSTSLRLTPPEIREILDDTAPVLVFADVDRAPRFAEAGVKALSFDEINALREGPRVSPNVPLDPDAPVVIISTSGSTAKPKGVIYTHRTMLDSVSEFTFEEPTAAPGQRVLTMAPMSVSAGYIKLMQYTMPGATLYVEPSFDAKESLRLLVEEKINAIGGAPVFYEQIAACEGFAEADLSSLTSAVVGGARVSRKLLETWLKKGVVIRQMYGQTESGGTSTITPPQLAFERPEICGCGRIFTELAVVDDKGARCAAGVQGEIIIRSPSVMVGYWNNPEATAEVLRDGWLYTGDIGVIDEDGMLTFVDRKKDIIISGGLNISAAEVERAVSEFDGVEEVLVIAAEDAKFGETPMAVIYARAEISVEALIAHCNTRLSDYKVPRYVVFEAEPMPRLHSGKLSKPAMRAKYKGAEASLRRVR